MRLLNAMAVALLAAGTAVAGSPASTRPNVAFTTGSPATTNNDDSCDISTLPAATLLLPYFEVDYKAPLATAQTTLFTIVNVTRFPQIAHCTIWTDWAFPILYFNIFLTGYDVQAINLYDVIANGVIAPSHGTSNTTIPGRMSAPNNANPNFAPSVAQSCEQLPGQIPAQIVFDVQTGLSTGTFDYIFDSCPGVKIGGTHARAVGYVTIDVTSTCSTTLPTTSSYYAREILFDNALTGDYEQINPNPQTGNEAGGSPLVHIRASPEGGAAGSTPGTRLPYTFYDRYTSQVPAGVPRTIDRRQPLPSAFAARYIEGGQGAFNTRYRIWREGLTGAGPWCTTNYKPNAALPVADIVRFDEHEYPTSWTPVLIALPPPLLTPVTSGSPTSGLPFPSMSSPSGDAGGWMYLNLDNGGKTCPSSTTVNCASIYSAARPGFRNAFNPDQVRQSQNWVTISMYAEGRYAVDFDAAALGNGCSPAPAPSTIQPIGPAGGLPVCPPKVTCAPAASYNGTNATP